MRLHGLPSHDLYCGYVYWVIMCLPESCLRLVWKAFLFLVQRNCEITVRERRSKASAYISHFESQVIFACWILRLSFTEYSAWSPYSPPPHRILFFRYWRSQLTVFISLLIFFLCLVICVIYVFVITLRLSGFSNQVRYQPGKKLPVFLSRVE